MCSVQSHRITPMIRWLRQEKDVLRRRSAFALQDNPVIFYEVLDLTLDAVFESYYRVHFYDRNRLVPSVLYSALIS